MIQSPSIVESLGEEWFDLVKGYFYNARFRLLTRTIEEIPNVLKEMSTDDGNELDKKKVMKEAILKSVEIHKTTLKALLRQNINDKKYSDEVVFPRLVYLADISLSSRFSDGKIKIPVQKNEKNTEKDLTALGIAASAVENYDNREFGISERFVVDAIDELCTEDKCSKQLAPVKMRLLIRAASAATTESARGFAVERIFLQSLVEMHRLLQGNGSHRDIPVSQLPFMKLQEDKEVDKEESDIKSEKIGWDNVYFIANYVKTHDQFGSAK